MPLRVLCVGAGLSGLSAAIALREDASSVTLLEAADCVEDMNVRAAGLGIYSCGVSILRNTLNIEPERDIQAVKGQSIRAINWKDGSLEREIEPSTADWYMAHRGSLLDALMNKATAPDGKGNPAQLLLGKRVTEVDVEAGIVTTSDGSVYEGDIIIGGEGVRSVVRRAIVDEAIVRPSGLSNYRWTMRPSEWEHLPNRDAIDSLIGPKAHCIITADEKDMRLVMYRCHSSGIVNGVLILPDYRLPHTSEDWAAAGSVDHLQSVVSGLGEPLKSVIGCVKSCGLWQLRKQAPLRTWYKGKAIIIGDAAHPMLPFQAVAGSLAMEDAEALQHSLRLVAWDPSRVPEALEKTFCMRFLRCSVIQHFSNASSFGTGVLDKAADWSLKRIASDKDDKVPLSLQGINDGVQQVITETVESNAGSFDVRATSKWVMDYISVEDFAKAQPSYILEKPFV